MRRIVLAVAVALALGGALAACGDDDGGGGGAEAKEQDQPRDVGEDDATSGSDEPEAQAVVEVGDTSLGEVLVDAEGKTLYTFANDSGTTTGASDALQAAWPPLVVESEDEAVAGDAIDASKLGTAMQADGRLWVTYDGHLLYRFSGDGAAGDTNGHKLGNVWFALGPDGNQLA
jgi:predicted lipoprotein with Yx(FWY)xxD motif